MRWLDNDDGGQRREMLRVTDPRAEASRPAIFVLAPAGIGGTMAGNIT